MALMVKDIAKKSRDTLFGSILHAIASLRDQVRDVKEAQLKINHNQLLLQQEILARVKHSGTVYLSEREILTKIFSGLKMYLDPTDLAITPHLALDGIWEHRITAAWLSVIKPTDTVLDIGSNNGYYGALAAQKTDKKKSKVVMFEANPKLIPYIQKTLSVNWLNEQCVLENLAVADKPQELTLHVLKDYIGSSSVHSNDHVDTYMKGKMRLETAEEVKVKAVSIDGYCKENKIANVDLIIMDIEGYEDTAYKGMRGIVQSSPSPTLFIEFTKGAYKKPEEFYAQMLADFGHVYVLDDEGYIIKPKDSSYETVIGDSDDWVMPIFSKNAKLATR